MNNESRCKSGQIIEEGILFLFFDGINRINRIFNIYLTTDFHGLTRIFNRIYFQAGLTGERSKMYCTPLIPRGQATTEQVSS